MKNLILLPILLLMVNVTFSHDQADTETSEIRSEINLNAELDAPKIKRADLSSFLTPKESSKKSRIFDSLKRCEKENHSAQSASKKNFKQKKRQKLKSFLSGSGSEIGTILLALLGGALLLIFVYYYLYEY